MKLYTEEFAADPHATYQRLRSEYGSLVPVEVAPGVPATLVIDYRTALDILTDPAHFPADPSQWEQSAPTECPVPTAMRWRPDASRTTGDEHSRYRTAVTGSLDRIDLHTLRDTVERTAVALINDFCAAGSADLLTEYAIPLTVGVLEEVLGFPPAVREDAYTAMMNLRNAVDAEAAEASRRTLEAVMLEVISAKRAAPARDAASWLIQHPARLSETELVHQMTMLYTTGAEPTWNLIAVTVLLLATDDRFGGELLGGALSTRDAIDEVLFTDPPKANFCFRYPSQPQVVGDVWLPQHHPVLIGLAACNNDPAAAAGERQGNRSHLAWGAGPHTCPAQSVAMVIVQEALDQLLDALPEIRLAIPADEVTWLPNSFHRAPATVPVTFPASPPLPFL
ncbi:cytochrome P450 [Nocardia abscessus]|uniref:cytochrome P450 n=1 Tax=Nocardia abscessus TaxID=120957 RepID=UPI001894BF56|nr:cytochrome P450 [Nocardia abscessus]MBF6338285.1 cytochrome P450 [Nocardia abscessus]